MKGPLVAALAIAVVSSGGCTRTVAPPYSIVAIEMGIYWQADDPAKPAAASLAFIHIDAAGPTAIPELAQALESERPAHRELAAKVLAEFVKRGNADAIAFMERRFFGGVRPTEAASLLWAMAQPGYTAPTVIARSARGYLRDQVVVEKFVPHDPRSYIRMCDLAAYVIQQSLGVDEGVCHGMRASEEALDRLEAIAERE